MLSRVSDFVAPSTSDSSERASAILEEANTPSKSTKTIKNQTAVKERTFEDGAKFSHLITCWAMWPANRFPSPGNRPWTFFGNFKPLFYTEQPEYWKSKPIVHLYANYSVLTSIFGVFLAFLGLVIFMFPVGARVVVGDWELSSYVTRDIDGFGLKSLGFVFFWNFSNYQSPRNDPSHTSRWTGCLETVIGAGSREVSLSVVHFVL